MSTNSEIEELWDWLRDAGQTETADLASITVTAIIFGDGDDSSPSHAELAIRNGTAKPDVVVRDGAEADIDTDWVWLLWESSEPGTIALERLLRRSISNPGYEVLYPLSLEPDARVPVSVVRTFGQTVTGYGRLRSLADPEELSQGQLRVLDVLGGPFSGQLVRTSLWQFLGGVNRNLPREVWGADFGWRANLSGAKVLVEPDAEVTDFNLTNLADERAGTLALMSAHTPAVFRPLRAVYMTIWTLLATLGFLIGKDFWQATEEIHGWLHWVKRRGVVKSISAQIQTILITAEARKKVKKLRPTVWHNVRHAAHLAFSRLADWISSFAGRGNEGSVSFDDMIGDDYSVITSTGSRRWSVLAIGSLVSVIGAVVAARNQFGSGALHGSWLLPAPDSAFDLIAQHLSSVVSIPQSASPPWVGLTGVLSFITFGQPNWFISVLLIGCVPLTWLAAYRFARTLSSNALVAAFASAGYALIPAVSGTLNAGGFTVVLWALLLPVAAFSWYWWRREIPSSWRGTGVLALWLTLLTALLPIVWPLSLIAAIFFVARWRTVRAALQWLLIEIAPVCTLFGPWNAALGRFPGRWLTGASPVLHHQRPLEAWRIPFVGFSDPGAAPLWLLVFVMGVLWLVALLAGIRRRLATIGLSIAVATVVLNIWVTRLTVEVSPGILVHPSGVELAFLSTAALLATAVIGFQGISDNLRRNAVGIRHIGALAVTGVSIFALVLAASWWVIAGQTQLARSDVGRLPKLVAESLTSSESYRVLALAETSSGTLPQLSWSLLRGGYTLLGDEETDAWVSGSFGARDTAKSVVYRLAQASEDDALLSDLQQLGVAFVCLTGGSAELISGISNTPGLGIATVVGANAIWAVPETLPLPALQRPEDQGWAWAQIICFAALGLLALPQVRDRRDISRPKRSKERRR